MSANAKLLYSESVAGNLGRIWEYDDGRFLFDWLQATGKGITVFCTTFEDAIRLWSGIRSDTLGVIDPAPAIESSVSPN